jgi:hypothetical protein
MTIFGQRVLAVLLPVSAFALCVGLAAQASTVQTLPVDRSTQIRGIDAACTGVGQSDEHENPWNNYPVKLEMVKPYGQYLEDEVVTLRERNAGELLRVRCDAPWVLMRLSPGRYRATVRVPNMAAKEIAFTVPQQGRRDVIVRFPNQVAGKETPRTTGNQS